MIFRSNTLQEVRLDRSPVNTTGSHCTQDVRETTLGVSDEGGSVVTLLLKKTAELREVGMTRADLLHTAPLPSTHTRTHAIPLKPAVLPVACTQSLAQDLQPYENLLAQQHWRGVPSTTPISSVSVSTEQEDKQ